MPEPLKAPNAIESTAKSSTLIEAKHLYKSYGKISVLKDVEFTVNSGEIVSIVGASGAGKTTLLHVLSTLEKPDKNSETLLKVIGEDITKLKGDRLASFRNRHIGFVFQFHQLLPEFTALENICLPAFINGRSKVEAEQAAIKWLEVLNLAHRKNHKPDALSGGEQQRVAIARALINNPQLIFADEPSGNLDSKNAEELHQLFLNLRDEFGYTFVLVTHNQALADLADRKLTMLDGKIVTEN